MHMLHSEPARKVQSDNLSYEKIDRNVLLYLRQMTLLRPRLDIKNRLHDPVIYFCTEATSNS